MKTIYLFFLVLCCSLSVNAQSVNQGTNGLVKGIWDDADPGVNGLIIGSQANNTYSALVLNGANQPFNINGKRDIVFKFKDAGQSIIRSYRGGSWDIYMQFLTTSELDPTPQVRMHINENGNIGIGTTTPQNKLDVNGTIRAKEVRIESGWADFVFKKDYQLPTLKEVKTHIDEKGTLPGVPSESEVKANGINIGETNALLLQKIEELTLYTIQQQELIELLHSRINKIESNK